MNHYSCVVAHALRAPLLVSPLVTTRSLITNLAANMRCPVATRSLIRNPVANMRCACKASEKVTRSIIRDQSSIVDTRVRTFNQEQSELHALENTPHITIRMSPDIHFSTYDKSGNPRTHYKYLGTYSFSKTQNKHTQSLLSNTISSFFNDLAPLPLSYTEPIQIGNSQLILSLTYHLIYNSPPDNLLDSLDSAIWSYISKQGYLSNLTPTKTKYGNQPIFNWA